MLKLGKEETFFQLLDGQASVAVKAAETFLALAKDLQNVAAYEQKLFDIEHEGDNLTHKLQNKLSKTFITPLDQEDLSELSHLLDDITDSIEAVAARIGMYRLTESREDLAPIVECLVKVTKLVESAVQELHSEFHKSGSLPDTLKLIHTLENESDVQYRAALVRLFDEPGIGPLEVMKWKEVYDRVETAIDQCEDVAKVVDNMIVKYA
jgi:predicted phosphate transport protein (TIGR00153 family)